MLARVRGLASILIGIALLVIANGTVSTSVALTVSRSSWALQLGGALGGLVLGAYFAGLTLGAMFAPMLLERVGHIRAFSAFAAAAGAGTLLLPLLQGFAVWIVLRAGMGFAMVGLFMVVESWLNERAEPQARGVTLAIYMVIVQLAFSAAQPLMLLYGPERMETFMLAALLFGLGAIPVALTRIAQPEPLPFARCGLRRLMRDVPLAAVGCFGAGMAGSVLLAIGPSWVGSLGLGDDDVARFMSAMLAAGILLQIPLGRLSDRIDRRIVLGGAAAALSLVSIAIAIWPPAQWWALMATGLLLGALVFVLYPLAIAHANDYLSAAEIVPASASLLLAFGAGATLGPLLASVAMTALEGSGGFGASLATATLPIALLAILRRSLRDAIPAEDQSEYVPVMLPQALATHELHPGIDGSQQPE
ncbi:MAG: MFS transporter [Myxococcales bacterium]|nr:MFS transporter [Myxococcales bacterium]